jgi:hypothetical protein
MTVQKNLYVLTLTIHPDGQQKRLDLEKAFWAGE